MMANYRTTKMDDSELLSAVKQEFEHAEAYVDTEVSQQRQDALDFYEGREFGDETDGNSKYVSRDVLDAIEWTMPSLMRIFTGGENVVEYKPQSPEDEEFCKQATDYANYILNNDNNGWLILYTWFKDALLSRVGVIKHYWSEEEKVEKRLFTGLDEITYIAIGQDDDVEITEHTEYAGPDGGILHDVRITRKTIEGRVEIENVPPEEFYVSPRSKFLGDGAVFHRVPKTRSELIAEGYDRQTVEELPQYVLETEEEQNRWEDYQNEYGADYATQEIDVIEAYVRLDYDGDGIAELMKVTFVNSEMLDFEEVSRIPFSVISPIINPHKFYGMSLADLTMDIQRIKSTLMRQMLENLYRTNNPEREVDVTKIVDLEDFLESRSGGIKRVKTIGASREIAVPFVAQHVMPVAAMLDQVAKDRTGATKASVDPNALQNTTATQAAMHNESANQRLELIARVFAETGVSDLFKNLLKIIVEHQDKERVIRLRNEWVPMDPRSWNVNMDTQINVGLGNSDRTQQLGQLTALATKQEQILAQGGMGMVTPVHYYNTLEKIVHATGLKSADPFFQDPTNAPPPPPPAPDPSAMAVQAQSEIERNKIQQKEMQSQRDHAYRMAQLDIDNDKVAVSREAIAADMDQTAAKIASDEGKASDALAVKAKLERERGDREDANKDIDRNINIHMGNQNKQVKMSRDGEGNLVGTVTDG